VPFTIRISRCHKGHELTVHANPINDDEINLTWICEECATARQTSKEPEVPELRGNKTVGGGRDESRDLVRTEEETKLHHVYELIDGRSDCVFYVGVTMNPNGRFYDHGAPNSPSAAFPRIQEIRQCGAKYRMQIVASFSDRRRAEAYEALLISGTVGVVNRATPPLRSVAAI